MKIEITKNGNLKISVSETEKELLKQQSTAPDFDSDNTMYDLFADALGNCEYRWIRPEDCGALTAAPILGTTDEDGEPDQVWAFLDYMVRSPQSDLTSNGYCIFYSGNA